MTDSSTSLKPVKYKPGQHPNSRSNLKPFPKGYNGNRQGYSLTSRLKDSLNKPLKKPKEDAPVGEHIIYSTLEGALLREATPFKETWDRAEGRLQDIPPTNFQDNRSVTIIVQGEKTKELIEGIANFEILNRKNQEEE